MVRFPATQQALPSNKCKCSFKLPQFLLLNYSFKYQFYYFICTSLETTTTCMLDSLCLYSILNLFSFIYFSYLVFLHLAMGFPSGSDGKASVYNAGDPGLIPGLGRSTGEGNGSPLQYSCLENPMDRGSWQATVHGVTKSWTRLSHFTFQFSSVAQSCPTL